MLSRAQQRARELDLLALAEALEREPMTLHQIAKRFGKTYECARLWIDDLIVRGVTVTVKCQQRKGRPGFPVERVFGVVR